MKDKLFILDNHQKIVGTIENNKVSFLNNILIDINKPGELEIISNRIGLIKTINLFDYIINECIAINSDI